MSQRATPACLAPRFYRSVTSTTVNDSWNHQRLRQDTVVTINKMWGRTGAAKEASEPFPAKYGAGNGNLYLRTFVPSFETVLVTCMRSTIADPGILGKVQEPFLHSNAKHISVSRRSANCISPRGQESVQSFINVSYRLRPFLVYGNICWQSFRDEMKLIW
jgi:hypothetical protein